MKKYLSLLFVAIAVLCLTGCGNKPASLVCSKTSGSNKIILTSNFVGNNLKSMGLAYDVDYSKYSDTFVTAVEKQDFCKKVSSLMYKYTLVDCKQKVENKHMIVTSGIDMSKFTKEETTGSPALTKEAMEKQGYTCELK